MLASACRATSASESAPGTHEREAVAARAASSASPTRAPAALPAPAGERGVYREPGERLVVPYPPGRWRLARFDELERALIWPAHILVRHREVAPGLVSFSLPLWQAAPPPPERTRREALELAERLAEQARAQPEQFAALARQHSEDIATRHAGGALGGVNAFKLSDWPEVLDALAALKPGGVSTVVETGYGFHVLSLRPPPEARRVGGARIVIGYDDAPWLHRYLARRPIPPRSHAAAAALAEQVYREARAAPGEFARLVAAYSEHREAEHGGDFGRWSTLEPTPFPDAVEVLQGLEPGEVAPPIDSLFGFQIIQRTEEQSPSRPAPSKPGHVRFGLPEPAKPDLDFYFEAHPRRDLLRELGAFAAQLPGLDDERRTQLRALHEGSPAPDGSGAGGTNGASFQALQAEVEQRLGAERYASYRLALEQRVERELLAPARGPRTFSMQ